MTNWIHLTEADLRPHLNAAQVETLLSRPNRSGPSDPLLSVLDETVSRIRTDIRTQDTNILSEDEATIPPELKRTACQLAVATLPGRIRGFLLSEQQEEAADEAEEVLSRIREGDLPVRLPSTPQKSPDVRTEFGVEVTRKRTQRLSGSQLNGL
ncbi:hypothetical protein H5P28_02120 [Ruficoccus amylovorans]|uniref:DUF1320 domain-containing protein n=1 Tax=Ruficoccus amylovorans TaxID=1804625 RepID=A0A842HBQ5_9BACT|nr:hypothetical protein [Ruficoccus amylovorans]MBC2593047.1 hypothetical protein [Ruficoccus amylovorans]